MDIFHLADIRKEYLLAALDAETAGNDPFALFHRWFIEAEASQIEDVNAMTLATVDSERKPHARIVLLKGLDETGFTFFTNYESHKGQEIDSTPFAALVFYWKALERQVRIEGRIEKIGNSDSDDYFASRPEGSQIGAWASPQSSVIADREILEERVKLFTEQYRDNEIPRPSFWGGYRVIPSRVEFWQGRSSRLHDRILFQKDEENNVWDQMRLAP